MNAPASIKFAGAAALILTPGDRRRLRLAQHLEKKARTMALDYVIHSSRFQPALGPGLLSVPYQPGDIRPATEAEARRNRELKARLPDIAAELLAQGTVFVFRPAAEALQATVPAPQAG